MAIRIYLIRHGQTKENVAGILQGHMPGELTEEGKKQVSETGEKLKDIKFEALYCSDLKRCMDSAEIINGFLNLEIRPSVLLRERDWKEFTGKYIRDVFDKVNEGTETIEEMKQRALRFIHEVTAIHSEGNILIVSHGLFCRVFMAVCFNKGIRDIARMENAEIRYVTLERTPSGKIKVEESGFTEN